VKAPKSVTFQASLPNVKSAMLLDGNGDGGQLKLDVPRSDTGALVLLHQFCTGKALKVTVEVLENHCLTRDNNGLGKGTKRQSKWTAPKA